MDSNVRRILLVDDDANVTISIKRFLEKTGRFEVSVENDSLQALDKAKVFRPDLVLLDVDMPRMEGGEVARRMRADAQLKCVPIVFLSALITRDSEGARQDFYYLSKPPRPADLLARIDFALRPCAANA